MKLNLECVPTCLWNRQSYSRSLPLTAQEQCASTYLTNSENLPAVFCSPLRSIGRRFISQIGKPFPPFIVHRLGATRVELSFPKKFLPAVYHSPLDTDARRPTSQIMNLLPFIANRSRRMRVDLLSKRQPPSRCLPLTAQEQSASTYLSNSQAASHRYQSPLRSKISI